jgi:hypothetical protein
MIKTFNYSCFSHQFYILAFHTRKYSVFFKIRPLEVVKMIFSWVKMIKSPQNFLVELQLLIAKDKPRYRNAFEAFVIVYLITTLFATYFYLFTTKNLDDFSKTLEMVPPLSAIFIRSIHFLLHRKKFEEILSCVGEIIEQKSFTTGNGLNQRVSLIQKIVKGGVIALSVGTSLMTVVTLLSHKLTFKMWFPYDHSSNEALFWLSVFYQLFLFVILGPVGVSIEFFPIIIVCYAIGIVDDVSEKLEEIGSGKGQEGEDLKELKVLIDIQRKTYDLVSKVTDVFGKLIWMQAFLSTVVLCSTVFTLAKVRSGNG